MSVVPIAAGLLAGLFFPAAAAAAPVDYARDLRPILGTNCFYCHGQDPATRKADIRLDTADGQAESGAIIPGKPQHSELVARIFSDDPDVQMPPRESNRSLAEQHLLPTELRDAVEKDNALGLLVPVK